MDYVALAAVSLPVAFLLTAGWQHVTRSSTARESFRRLLGVRERTGRRLELCLGIFEITGGIAVAICLTFGGQAAFIGLVGLLSQYVVYLSYLAVLWVRGSDVPCGCSTDSTPVSLSTIARTASLAALAAFSLAIQLTAGPLVISSPDLVAILAAALVLVLIMGTLRPLRGLDRPRTEEA